VQVLAKLPDRKRDRLAFAAQRFDDSQRSRRIAREPRLGQFLDVEARDVGDRALDVIVRERSLG